MWEEEGEESLKGNMNCNKSKQKMINWLGYSFIRDGEVILFICFGDKICDQLLVVLIYVRVS